MAYQTRCKSRSIYPLPLVAMPCAEIHKAHSWTDKCLNDITPVFNDATRLKPFVLPVKSRTWLSLIQSGLVFDRLHELLESWSFHDQMQKLAKTGHREMNLIKCVLSYPHVGSPFSVQLHFSFAILLIRVESSYYFALMNPFNKRLIPDWLSGRLTAGDFTLQAINHQETDDLDC
jgi:hypothetical protein